MTRRAQVGFTIVELLIVIVLIGILATITIVAYNGVQEKAKNGSVESDLYNLTEQINLAGTNNGGGSDTYPQSHTDLVNLGSHLSPAGQTIIYCYDPVNNDYALIGRELSKSTTAAGFIWKEVGSKIESSNAYDTSLTPAQLCTAVSAAYTFSDIGSSFAS